MVWFLLVIGCYQTVGPAPTGSPSALLASQTAEVGRRAERLALASQEIDGLIDQWRTAEPGERAVIEASVREKAKALEAEAESIQATVTDLEEQARVWDP